MPTRVLDDPGPLRVERLPDGRRELLRCLCVDVSPNGDGSCEPITVRKGFHTDYSSLPWGLRWLVNWERVDIAGVVHDHLYRTTPSLTYRSRWEADLIWFRLARSGGHRANWLQAALGLAGLYLGACWVKPAWSKCTWQHKGRDGDRRSSASWVAHLGAVRMAALAVLAERPLAVHHVALRRAGGTRVRSAAWRRGGGEPVAVEGSINGRLRGSFSSRPTKGSSPLRAARM